jgi:hypothetical protein
MGNKKKCRFIFLGTYMACIFGEIVTSLSLCAYIHSVEQCLNRKVMCATVAREGKCPSAMISYGVSDVYVSTYSYPRHLLHVSIQLQVPPALSLQK